MALNRLEKIAQSMIFAGALTFPFTVFYPLVYHAIRSPSMDCSYGEANPLNCVNYKTDEEKRRTYKMVKEEMYKGERLVMLGFITSTTPAIIGATLIEYIRKRREKQSK